MFERYEEEQCPTVGKHVQYLSLESPLSLSTARRAGRVSRQAQPRFVRWPGNIRRASELISSSFFVRTPVIYLILENRTIYCNEVYKYI